VNKGSGGRKNDNDTREEGLTFRDSATRCPDQKTLLATMVNRKFATKFIVAIFANEGPVLAFLLSFLALVCLNKEPFGLKNEWDFPDQSRSKKKKL
jgi:hypothetical protein